MYPIKDVNNYEGTSQFIKKMIALLDGHNSENKKDGKIQNEELQASYNKPELSHIFSRMVCKHKSEWSYGWEKIKSDYEKFIEYHYPKPKQEYIDERLDEIKAKYKGLYDFWNKLEFKTDTFWYFEPFAWVEQMKRVFSVSKWHDPVDNPMCTIFTQSQVSGQFNENGKHWGLFGKTRGGSTHQGLDLFAIPNDNVYACVEGIIYEKKRHEGYGQTVTIKITDRETFLTKKREYQLLYPNDGEIEQGDYYNENDDIFLFYAHLDEILVKKNDNVKAGDIIAFPQNLEQLIAIHPAHPDIEQDTAGKRRGQAVEKSLGG